MFMSYKPFQGPASFPLSHCAWEKLIIFHMLVDRNRKKLFTKHSRAWQRSFCYGSKRCFELNVRKAHERQKRLCFPEINEMSLNSFCLHLRFMNKAVVLPVGVLITASDCFKIHLSVSESSTKGLLLVYASIIVISSARVKAISSNESSEWWARRADNSTSSHFTTTRRFPYNSIESSSLEPQYVVCKQRTSLKIPDVWSCINRAWLRYVSPPNRAAEVCSIPKPHNILAFNYLWHIIVSAKPINTKDENDNKISI